MGWARDLVRRDSRGDGGRGGSGDDRVAVRHHAATAQ